MSIFSSDLYSLLTLWNLHYAAPVVALLLAALWIPAIRAQAEAVFGKNAVTFLSGALTAVLSAVVAIVGWQLLGSAATPTSSPDGSTAAPLIDLDKLLLWSSTNFRIVEGWPVYYYVPWLTVGLILLYCALDRLDKVAASRSHFRKALFWIVLPLALLSAAALSVANGFAVGFLISFVLLGAFMILGIWRLYWADAAIFVKGMTTALFLVLAALAALNYFNFANWRYNDFFNAYEFYHYYIGAKYAPEVGYMGMYEASLIADEETGLKYGNPKGGVRNLTTARYYATREEVLDRRDEIKGWFSTDRWDEFTKDIAFFKSKLVKSRWDSVLRDKGYNATPVWTAIVGGGLSSVVSTDNETGMYLLAMLDLFLIAAATLCIVWAFGPNAALMMLIVLGTSYVMKYSHMKGAYLRTDFAMSIIIAICLIKKDCYKLAGAFTAYSIMSRVFPAAFLFGIGAKFFWDLVPTIWRAPAAWVKRGVTQRGAAQASGAGLVLWAGFSALILAAALRLANPQFTQYRNEFFVVAAVAGFLLAYFSVTSLWGLIAGGVKRGYAWYFVSAAITLVVLFAVSIVYAALTPDYDRYAAEMKRSNPDISATALRARFLTRYWEEYAVKIGRHNEDISPWRVGFKYLFINQWPKKEAPWTQAYGYVSENGVAASWDALHANGQSPRQVIESQLKENKPYTRSVRWNDKSEVNAYMGYTLYQWRWIIPLAVIALSLFFMIGLKDHEAFAYSFVPVFFLASGTYYYYIMLLIPLLFFSPFIGRPSRALGAIMIVFFAMPGYYLYRNMGWAQQFPTYYYHSLMYGILCVYMMLCAGGDTFTKLVRGVAGGRDEDAAADAAADSGAGPDPVPVPAPPRVFEPARTDLASLVESPIETTDASPDDRDIAVTGKDAADEASAPGLTMEAHPLESMERAPLSDAAIGEGSAAEFDEDPLDVIENAPDLEVAGENDDAPEADARPLDVIENTPPFDLPEPPARDGEGPTGEERP